MKFVIEGRPQGKARARTFWNSRTGKMQSITPEQTRSYEDLAVSYTHLTLPTIA